MKTKKNVFRVGDRVKIVNPQMFVRCGYPWTLNSVLTSETIDQHIVALEDFMREKFQIEITDKLMREIAFGIMKKHHFGGKTRSIYTEPKPGLLGMEANVVGKKVVLSGNYNSGHSYCSMDGNEYDPPYLSSIQKHVILDLHVYLPGVLYWEGARIEDCWVEKVAAVQPETAVIA